MDMSQFIVDSAKFNSVVIDLVLGVPSHMEHTSSPQCAYSCM